MIYKWTNEDIEQILLQLNQRHLPFNNYMFSKTEQGLKLLGSGGNAKVYEAVHEKSSKNKYAIKVIGFGDEHVDNENFRKLVKIQEEMGKFQDHIVKIFDWTELRVWIEGNHRVVKVEEINGVKEEIRDGDFLQLQFIVMEKLDPVIERDSVGRPKLFSSALSTFDEKEILKLAYEIGLALSKAHENKLLHRDVKLENIFYSQKEKKYKLGDFGIAKTTRDGLASTVAFTKGYGAPEVVGKLDDKYDHTADIYSFGMMLYVLLNEMRFPESKGYHANIKMQYSQGYLPPWPKHGTNELCQVIEKMCRFHPDNRYQSVNEVLNDLDKIIYGISVKYKREHKKVSFVVGILFFLLFVGTMLADKCMMFLLDNTLEVFSERWVKVTFLVLAITLLWDYSVVGIRDSDVTRMYLKTNLIWLFVGINSIGLIVLGFIAKDMVNHSYKFFSPWIGIDLVSQFLDWNPIKIGLACMSFCIFWKVRETWLAYTKKRF